MREIDNRYPEFARPYEPVKGGRHHAPLTGNEAAMMVRRRVRHLDMARRGFLMGVGILILLTLLLGPLNPDRQAPPPGTQGTVLGVDDTGSLLMRWDNGSGLNVVYGEDLVKKL